MQFSALVPFYRRNMKRVLFLVGLPHLDRNLLHLLPVADAEGEGGGREAEADAG